MMKNPSRFVKDFCTPVEGSQKYNKFNLVTHLRSNWNAILSEVQEWYEVLRRVTATGHIPAAIGTR